MAGRIPQNFIDDLVARADVVELIGARVPLKKAGREYKACCPFHEEKTPSFWVSPDKQFYHCVGCGAHGTALSFLMNYDKLSFVDAVEELAGRLGIEVPREAGGADSRDTRSAALYDINASAAKFFAASLLEHSAAREYTEQRGLTTNTIEVFSIGYAPDSWNALLNRFGTNDAACQTLADAGLVIERERGGARARERYYDRFRNRLMFPIRDARGRVLAFGGRVIGADEPKYLNSPETPLFQKGRELYGLYECRQNRAPLTRLLVVEGYMDVARLHQAGIRYAVATLGTATTAEHLRRIFKLVSEVVFCFDGDRAGRAAAWRALGNALPEARDGRQIRFLFLPEGQDPDSLVGTEGRDAFEQRIEAALPLSEYLVRALGEDIDLSHADGRAQLAELARPLVNKVPAGVFRDLLIQRLSESIGLASARLRTRRPAARAAIATGRGGVVTQAVKLLVHFPAVATRVNPAVIANLASVRDDGAQFMHGMLRELRERPATHTGQLLERFRERPEYTRLQQLAAQEALIGDEPAALAELEQAILRIALAEFTQRYDDLLGRSAARALSTAEQTELLELADSMRELTAAEPSPKS
jgi:DNA primase